MEELTGQEVIQRRCTELDETWAPSQVQDMLSMHGVLSDPNDLKEIECKEDNKRKRHDLMQRFLEGKNGEISRNL